MRKYIAFLSVIILALGLVGCNQKETESESDEKPKASNGAFPNKTLEIIAPASPGGGWDTTARAIQKIMKEENLADQNITVVNKPGGGGEVGWQYLSTKDAHHIAINSSLILSNKELGISELSNESFTPLAILATEWISLSASNQSKLTSGKEAMEKLKKDPKSLTIGVAPGLGNNDHLAFVQAAKTYGVDVEKLNILVYKSGGDLQTALIGGHVDIASTAISEVKEQHQTEKLRVLATTSDKRIKGLEDVPTWKEQGVNMVFPHWRGVMGPKDMTDEERAYWDKTLSKVVKTKSWQTLRENKNWDDFYKDSKESEKFLKEQRKKYKRLVDEAGF
ncbi:tripartite tricarboxylate transporter substrate binding protein [Staphylococcus massiliensis]|uniref:Putative lipoprotein n=1 Tax=Staphylococcus massiliensis S46 TaxID=1229783 RepID=K9AWQ4_9STAP|nr:tripartite tricarboxylate transporter substrate-binding protein [Staphylococcus massiliensis]EKU50531.1 putative lipoprotein [Staphylococcus massiliensis S46]MCG3398698.1 tripartite tricarboxylate transporter substrate binding protein [Staphylococcus massiliensis]POA00401.1 tripartite tricarboxylate transporter substrate binding protein [Staphylococcus massiliensis CCUG 55927]